MRQRDKSGGNDQVNFHRLTLGQAQALVGRTPHDVQVFGKWVVMFFSGTNMTVRFRKW